MGEDALLCKNCDSELKPEFEFCPSCGQKVNDELTLKILFYNTISNYFSFDARFLKSFFPLMFKPGYLARKYLDGKRLLFLHPAQMYLFVSFAFFFIFSFSVQKQADQVNDELKKTLSKSTEILVNDSIESMKKDSVALSEIRNVLEENKKLTGMDSKEIDSLISSTNGKTSKMDFDFNEEKIDSLIEINADDKEIYKSMGLEDNAGYLKRKIYAQGLKLYKARNGGDLLKTFYDTIPVALFILLPLFALILKILYYKRGRYSHHLVFSFYYFSFLFTLFSMLFCINFILDIPDWIDWLIVISTFIYLGVALKRFYQRSWIGSFFKAGVATFTFMAIVLPTAAIIIGFYAFLFY